MATLQLRSTKMSVATCRGAIQPDPELADVVDAQTLVADIRQACLDVDEAVAQLGVCKLQRVQIADQVLGFVRPLQVAADRQLFDLRRDVHRDQREPELVQAVRFRQVNGSGAQFVALAVLDDVSVDDLDGHWLRVAKVEQGRTA